MMSIQEKSKENSSNVIKKSEDKNLETQIQGSQSNLAKKSGPKETVKSLVKSSSESKINQPELGTCMSTRSAKAASSDKKASKSSSKNMVTVKGHSQQDSTKKKKKLPQKNSVHGTSKSNEQLNRRSQRLQQLTEVSTRSLRNREIQGQVQAVKQTLPPRKEHCNNSQNKSNKVKTSQKHVKRKVPEIKSDSKEDEHLVTNEVINSPKGKKRKVEHQTAYTCSSQCIKGSEKYLQKNVKKEETKSVPVTSEIKSSKMITSAVSKKNEVKKSVHTQVNTSAKSQKSPQPSVPEQSVDNELEQVGRNKRGSILQLCEEIAGEIESDTVEVKKESSQMESVKEEKPTEIKLEETDNERQILHQKETNQDVHCNRFFPSRKTKPVKCILNGINSSTKKNSNWTKIKLSKFNSVQQNKLDSQVSPKLGLIRTSFSLPALEMHHPATQSTFLGTKPHNDKNIACQQEEMKEINSEEVKTNDITVEVNKTTKRAPENCHLDNQIKPPPDPPLDNQMKESFESTPDKDFSLCLESKLENSPVGNISTVSALLGQAKIDTGENKFPGSAPKQHTILSNQTSKTSDNRETPPNHSWPKCNSHLEITIPKVLKLKEAEKVDEKQLIIDAGQKRFGAVSCNVCGMLYTASNPEDETQHLLFHNQFISAVKYVGWKKERILAEYPDGRIIMVLPEDPKYALKKVDEIREMVDNDLGFQQAPLMCYSRTKTLLFISNDKKVVGCLIAEHIQWGYRVIEEKLPVIRSEEEKVRFERQKAWCCSTLPEPAICGISRIWVFSMMRRKKIASRMIECLRSNFIYGSYLSKEEIAFSDPTPDGKLFATQYCGTGQFLVYNFINGQNST
ncbi:N-acetyltransferase ESCO1 [Vulpes lagopus]|uniref:N-acetyltransferase ESCO1 n=1 Tax=Vulpes lagopus TaxID=494514 RepID=UPI001BC97A3A|nr:N-acetyltransferase ESCO1 [Vulpes lagopus]XP_041610558.1 N-acetyltransferase ESCO1 [Vulpes lagopus]XP_041610633.1 N-acetyltransferase ESCO1 [Vulpes lagopus]XP_041610708.1 N-acetyltransferase ESCO1 [Vulpes lagopus]XP_041610754.1 N-acetyltransferase ESCO1 [Vulpes lagopus]XP_041610844.1 N-acetyltransferase ESCO1 [Vulpes lagopus]XP_041610934.1 N-acetyltransferase ESCO1 [Vulpes lagopus]XP_041611025.1 N-acetyltransferase ESCO1 [Vulpes lagopus]XP_041611091.1 N-acetyltransferase ESCO1 [Vulpes la